MTDEMRKEIGDFVKSFVKKYDGHIYMEYCYKQNGKVESELFGLTGYEFAGGEFGEKMRRNFMNSILED